MGLVEIDQYSGSYAKSCTKFTRHDLTFFEISLNSDVLNGYPIELRGRDTIDFYRKWLQNTNRLDNPFCPTVLTHSQFDNSNFLLVHNFDNENGQDGQVTVKIKFSAPLTEKLMLLFMPVTDKKIMFDAYFNVQK